MNMERTAKDMNFDDDDIDISMLIREKRNESYEKYWDNRNKFKETLITDQIQEHLLAHIKHHRSEIRNQIIKSIREDYKFGPVLKVGILSANTLLNNPSFYRFKEICEQYDQGYYSLIAHALSNIDQDVFKKELGLSGVDGGKFTSVVEKLYYVLE